MAEKRITVNLNGPLKVEGAITLVDHEGKAFATKEGLPFFLCRCGHSHNKPFCDGTHKREGFQGS